MNGKPLTSFLITAFTLYAIWLWRQGRLGHIGGGAMAPKPKFTGPPIPEGTGGWKVGTPPIAGSYGQQWDRMGHPQLPPVRYEP